jgi:G3E family GTPase
MTSRVAIRTRFVILGGYLGAGKTTLATSIARELRDKQDMSVAIITNDQGNVLVDTEFVRNAGFDVKDVIGGCFCSNLNEFIKNARSLVQMERPDIIIAEPIGTSTNILASVVVPLRTLHPDEFELAPLFVVLDGTRVSELLAKAQGFGLGAGKMIPAHQVHEAEYVLISKADKMTPEEIAEATRLVKLDVPEAKVISFSSKSGTNLEQIVDVILSQELSTKAAAKADNRLFATEKASMGWYNATAILRTKEPVDLYVLTKSLMKKVSDQFGSDAIAHVKVLVESKGAAVKMSLVNDTVQTDGIRGGRYLTTDGRLILNARVSASPQELKEKFPGIITSSIEELGVQVDKLTESAFEPKPETPSHLMDAK